MTTIKTIEGELTVTDARFGIVVARFNGFIAEPLLAGALDTLHRLGVPDEAITVVKVPGAFEVPLAADKMAASGKYDAVITLGAVIRGATPHFDYVAGECAKGVSTVATRHGLPVVFGGASRL